MEDGKFGWSVVGAILFGAALGAAGGHSIGRERGWKESMSWANGETANCEGSPDYQGNDSISECLELKIWEMQDEIEASNEP